MNFKDLTEEELRENKFEYLKSFVTSGVIQIIAEEENLDIKESFAKFYDSSIAKKLENKKTGLYLESPAYIYELYKECENIAAML